MNEKTPYAHLLPHLLELRTRLLYCLLFTTLIFIALLPFANKLYTALALPLLTHLPAGTAMIATAITSSFWAPLKLTLVCALLLAIPFLLYQCWAFIAPALYQRERYWIWLLLLMSTLLFYLGVGFGYGLVFPWIFHFLTLTAPHGVTVMPDISLYLDFALQLLFAFGVAFEVPVAVILLVKTGMTTRQELAHKRPYFIIAAFVLGMIVAPDVLSQIALAVPLCLLFEIGLLILRFFR